MSSRATRKALATVVAVTVVALTATGVAGADKTKRSGRGTVSPEQQLAFGIDMAKRGLWNEALFRFKRAGQMRPGDPSILNNMAVAYEAVGEFDKALDAYKQALKSDPSNQDLKRNYSRFVEFYQSFRPPEAEKAAEEASGEEQAAPDSSRG